MRRTFTAIAVGMLALLAPLQGLAADAQSTGAKDEGRWPGGRRAAILLTYDDGLETHLANAAPDLTAAGLKGTFFINGTIPTADVARWRAVAAAGHELGNHSLHHPCLRATFDMPARQAIEGYSVDWMLKEIGMLNTLLHAIDGKTDRSYALPCGQPQTGDGDYVGPLMKSGLVRYLRDYPAEGAGPLAAHYRAPAIWFDADDTGADLIAVVKEAEAAGEMRVFGFHGVGGDHLIVTAQAHRELVAYLKAHRKEIWVPTFAQAMQELARKPR